MATQQPPNQDRPKLMGKKPEIIVRARITEVEAKKHKDGPIAGIEIQVDFEKVDSKDNFLEVWFLYRAVYKHDIGYIQMKGLLLLEMPEKRAARIAEAWNTKREMDQWIAQALLQNVNYKCGAEAMLAGKLIELPSPIVPPPIGISPGEEPAQGQPMAAPPQAVRQTAPQAARPAAPQQPAAQTPPIQPRPVPPAPPPATGQPPVRPIMPTFNTPFTGRKPN
jgi:hypothetical protein